jgi:AraC family transcriptional regulator
MRHARPYGARGNLGWLPDSGYQPDDRACLEIYRGAPTAGKAGAFRCELCLPARPL